MTKNIHKDTQICVYPLTIARSENNMVQGGEQEARIDSLFTCTIKMNTKRILGWNGISKIIQSTKAQVSRKSSKQD